MTSSVTRQRKRAKKNARRAQRIAWMVELRLLGFHRNIYEKIKDAGNHADAEGIYRQYVKKDPKMYRLWEYERFVDSKNEQIISTLQGIKNGIRSTNR